MNAELERCDLLITGGEVIDGTGAAARKADIALQGDRIVALGELAGVKADSVIDASVRLLPRALSMYTPMTIACYWQPRSDTQAQPGSDHRGGRKLRCQFVTLGQ
ncbi:MAG: hypothetical protein Ct9H300mP16_00430 [Pseudomonadota bacterium]|nr:MAG: hypothetical protein Ct9H300mP16_00430 [Pseudomonadota bacterium]